MSDLLREISDGVGIITLNRPAALNAVTHEMWHDLVIACEELASEPTVRAVILTGAGRGFCAGGDVKGMAARNSASLNSEQMVERLTGFLKSVRCLAEMPKPTIAAVRGPAAGAGLSLALACDFRIIADDTAMTTAFARVGLSGDFGASYFLTQLIGAGRARELMMTSPTLDAETALHLGLANRVVQSSQLEQEAMTFARQLAEGPTIAFEYMKQNINAVANGASLEQLLELEARNMIASMQTEDHSAAAKAFVEKRQPIFRGA
jgi:2-(1,2-epoxy-1,2-dihydrophenyl)acetyl-CoA isomerase